MENREAIKWIESRMRSGCSCDEVWQAGDIAIIAIEKQIPKKPTHVNETHEKHLWQTNSKGEIDEYAYCNEFHNGPVCLRCGYTPCVHCEPNYDSTPCVVDHNICPRCGERVYFETAYCEHCGQALDWNKYREDNE